MVSFSPLLEFPFQIVVRQSSQTRNLSNALSIRAMTNSAGHSIGIRISVLI